MSLSKLPQELLDRVAFFCGGDFLRADPRRTTLCKAWHAAATRELQRHIALTDRTSLALLADGPCLPYAGAAETARELTWHLGAFPFAHCRCHHEPGGGGPHYPPRCWEPPPDVPTSTQALYPHDAECWVESRPGIFPTALRQLPRVMALRCVGRDRALPYEPRSFSHLPVDFTAPLRAIGRQLAAPDAPRRLTRLELDFPKAGPAWLMHGMTECYACAPLNAMLRA